MKGCYILIGTASADDHTGIGLKIRNQIKAFNDAGLNFEEYVLPVSKSKLLALEYRLPFANANPVWSCPDLFKKVDCIYMRRPFVMNWAMRKVFREIKQANPQVKIVVEIPTYPYDAEYNTYKIKSMLIVKDKYNRVRMDGLVDRFAVLSGEKEVFGIPTVRIVNGIDVDAVEVRRPIHLDDGSLHICAVAAFKEWHGYERIIEGVKDYYSGGGTRNLVFHFAGEGSALPGYRQLVSEYGLEDHFIFHGYIEGQALDDIYNQCTLALGSFGMYKIGINLACNLKSREAVARGIPMVTGCPTDIYVKEKYRYFMEFPNDPSSVDIQRVIDFNDEIYKEDEETVINTIRQYAYDNISMDTAMKDVIDFFKGTSRH